MMTVRRSEDRGYVDRGWLKSHHSFSFADYHDPARMGWGNLRIVNEDRIAPGTGFGLHGHRDMEILSFVLDGALGYCGDLGDAGGGMTVPGDVHRMTAGTGVWHREFNRSPSGAAHFLQAWLLPSACGLPPGCEQKHFEAARKRGRLCLVAAPGGEGGSVTLNADARVYAGLFDGGEAAELVLDARPAYVHVARGALSVNGRLLRAGDAAVLADERVLRLGDGRAAEVLVFALASAP